MSQNIELKSSDGHPFDAYLAEPAENPKAALVILQEIFGVNPYIRSVADDFAEQGYLTIAPALFDRARRHVELAYDAAGIAEGVAIYQTLPLEGTLADIQAAIIYLRQQMKDAKVGVVGYCWGGTLAWLSNTRLHPDATVSYYPGRIQDRIMEKATCPAIFHFGTQDAHFPPTIVEMVRQEYPGFPVFTYDAGHGFSCDARASYNREAAALARQRTLSHLEEYLVTAAH